VGCACLSVRMWVDVCVRYLGSRGISLRRNRERVGAHRGGLGAGGQHQVELDADALARDFREQRRLDLLVAPSRKNLLAEQEAKPVDIWSTPRESEQVVGLERERESGVST
jgi:hypothetical protein